MPTTYECEALETHCHSSDSVQQGGRKTGANMSKKSVRISNHYEIPV